MRICMMSREYPPETGWGGIGAYSYQLSHELARLGHEVHVVCLAKASVNGGDPEMYVDEQVNVHRVVWGEQIHLASLLNKTQPNTHHLLRAAIPMWKKFLQLHKEKPFEVVEAPDHLAEGFFVALTRIAPLLIRLHTPFSKLVAEGYHNIKPDFDSYSVSLIERMAMSQADVLSSPSVNLAEFVAEDTGVELDQIEIVRNPVDTKKFSPVGKKAELKIPASSKIVYFAGRLEGRKGIKFLIEAVPQVVKAVPEAHFVVVGADTNTGANKSSILQSLKESLTKNHVLDKVHFASHIALNEMPEYYRKADICVVPSLFDNAPYTVLEALASGKPVIGSTAGGTPEYIQPGITGLHVPKADSAALAKAIIELLQDDSKRLACGQKARAVAEKSYACNVIASEALKTYALAIERHKHRKDDPIYKHSPDNLAKDTIQFVRGYNGLLHTFGEQVSIRYRTGLSKKLLATRPKLFSAKVALISAKAAKILSGQSSGLNGLISHLERSIEDKSPENWD